MIASILPKIAIYEPIYFLTFKTNISNASLAFSSPSSIFCSITRISLLPPIARRPDFLFIILSTSSPLKFAFFIKNGIMAGSMLPQRVPIIRPSSGVSPIVVSMHLPSLIAAMLAPLPRCRVMQLNLS